MVGGERVLEVAEQLTELLGKVVVREGPCAVALQGVLRERVGTRRAPDAEIDATGEQAGQEAELFGDLQRAVVREHHGRRFRRASGS